LLSQEPAWTIVLMWAPGASDDPRHPGDDAFARDILARTHAHPVVPMPTHSLDELVAALSVCHIFIGADGGAMHIAAGVSLPIVGLFENSEFKLKHWHPWRVPCELVHSDTEHDVSAIAPAAVFAAWRRLVSQCA
jgi:ADP-heptose:LPS heptosyltransferase